MKIDPDRIRRHVLSTQEADGVAQALMEAATKARDRVIDHMHRMVAERHINACCTCEQCKDDRDWLARWFDE